MLSCRICLQADGGRLFYPCRCKAPVHQKCLDAWRTSGINPANLTRCEVCQYHYRIGRGASSVRACTVHMIFYCVAVLFYGIIFFGLAFGFGQLIRQTEILDVVDWGRLTFFKPESTGGFLFLGVCINFFLIGVASTIYLFFLWMTGRLRQRLVAARRMGSWTTGAHQQRRQQADCCRDCCHGWHYKDCDLVDCCYLYCLFGNHNLNVCYPCEACCGLCDHGASGCCECNSCSASCLDCKDCCSCSCGDCGGCGGDDPLTLVFMGILAFLALCLVVLGAFVMLWFVMANVMYGIFLHQRYVKQQIARTWPVQDYDSALDEKLDLENTQPGTNPDQHDETNESMEKGAADVETPKPAAPSQVVMEAKSTPLPLPGEIEKSG
eukprot:Skav220825  [mRNA]  locus=scaffold1888:5088:6752:+ [translate_table: standard]